MSFSVVILSARAENLVPCVKAVLAAEPDLPPERIVVVDDGARKAAEPRLPGVRWVPGVKPFVFARNANLGIRAAGTDVILLNDDARLIVPRGFTLLAEQLQRCPDIGICSAAVRGVVGNLRQRPAGQRGIRIEPQQLAFVCVYIPRRVYECIGLLDERFAGYGFDDNDYCARTRAQGWKLGICDSCIVDHQSLRSTYRTRADIHKLFMHNRRLYEAKQHERPDMDKHSVDLLYLACNRLEYTRETFTALASNTGWDFVRELVVYDDGSQDGTCEWLGEAVGRIPAAVRFERTRFGSPVTAMLDFIRRAQAPILAKVDNDAMMPPGWLEQALAVLDRHPDLDLLGLEAHYPYDADPQVPRGYTPAEFISGIGLYRRRTFAHDQPTMFNKYFGLEEWQIAKGGKIKRGWITPALPVFLLDRMPTEPWSSLSLAYEQRGWQRPRPHVYDANSTLWHWRWAPNNRATSAAPQADTTPPIPSRPARRLDFSFCDTPPQPGYENVQVFPFPEPGQVDLRAPWPWEADSFAHIRAYELLEHLPDKLHTMNELWRVLAPGGTVELAVPTTDGTGAFQDPTHVSFWNRRSFLYFEAGSPERERLARRADLQAAFMVVEEHTQQTIDGPCLLLKLRAIKAAPHIMSAAPELAAAAPIHAAAGHPGFVCALRVKNEAEHIREVLEAALRLCERALVFDDHSTDATPEICRSFGERVTLVGSPFEGLDEARDKNYLLRELIAAAPDWVLWIDGDEVLERSGPEKIRRAVAANRDVACYALRIAYLWDDPGQVRVDGVYGNFFRPSLFRLKDQPLQALAFLATGVGGNFHCGNVPRGLVGGASALEVRLKHYGYMTRDQRLAKYRWYNEHDPNNEIEDRYRHIAEIRGARHAPGPARFIPWRE
jgi:GT2 family glycosyltransferase